MATTLQEPKQTDTHPNGETPPDTRPYLCIPYWKAPRFPGDAVDIGAMRPLPGDVASWDCIGIHAGPYTPGKLLEVRVDVRNSGPGNATPLAIVVVYWADPSVGFAKPTFFSATTVPAPTCRDPFETSFVTTTTMAEVIPATAPNHICLLAAVTHSMDKAGIVTDPVTDRHWAQKNLVVLVVTAGKPLIIPFMAGNPFMKEQAFELRVEALNGRALEALAMRMKGEASDSRLRMHLVNDMGRPVTDRATEGVTRLTLEPLRRRQYSLILETELLGDHELIAAQAVLSTQEGKVVGSLGFVVRGEDTAQRR